MTGNVGIDEQFMERSVLETRVRKIASVYTELGLGDNDVIAILMRNDISFVEQMLACRYLGARYVALNWHSPASELLKIIEDANADILVGHEDLLEPFPASSLDDIFVFHIKPPNASPTRKEVRLRYRQSYNCLESCIGRYLEISSDPKPFKGIFAYTSGSTGRPKGIAKQLPNDGPDLFQRFGLMARHFLKTEPLDKFFIPAPIYHGAPNAISLFVLASGDVDLILASKFGAEDFLAQVEVQRLTHAYLVPTMMIRLLKLPKSVRDQYDLTSLRYVLSSGAPCPVHVRKEIIQWMGPILFDSYGSSEIGFMTLIGSDEATRKPGSVGRAIQGTSIRIYDDNFRQLSAGQTGLIYISTERGGDFTYSRNGERIETERIDGHATVGDVGYLDSEGYLFICDRQKDMIIRGGANVFPAELESLILQMDQIADCAIFGAPDPEFGEKIIAAVTCIDDATISLDEIQAYLAGKIAKFKHPQKLDVHEFLPREDSGKIFKGQLRLSYWNDAQRNI